MLKSTDYTPNQLKVLVAIAKIDVASFSRLRGELPQFDERVLRVMINVLVYGKLVQKAKGDSYFTTRDGALMVCSLRTEGK